jgi:trigger factor
MQVSVEKLSPVMVEFRVEVPATTVSAEVDKADNQLKRTAKVRGFRKGKAPRKVLKQLYSRAIHADVAQRLMDQSLQQALVDKSMQPLTQPAVEPAELNPAADFSFKARFEVRPEIEKVEWEGLEATRASAKVDDDAVKQEVERLQREHATLQPVEGREAKEGDIASLSLDFELDGETKNEQVDAELGSGQVLSSVEEAVVGMKPGDAKDVEHEFVPQHPNTQLRGKTVSFKVKVEELKERVLPEVDDEFAKDCDHENLDELKKALSEKLEKRMQQQVDEELAKQLVEQLCSKNPVPVPPSLVEQQSKLSERELRAMAQMSGQPLTMTPEIQARMRADSEMKVRAGLLMAEIAKEKEVKVTDEDLEQGYTELAEQTGKNVAKIKAEYRERSQRDMLIGMILEDKVLDLLEGAAKITDA